MNPERIYRNYRDEALAEQLGAKAYETFVAMPFKDVFSYKSREVFAEVICKAANRANERNETPRQFAKPFRVDDVPGTAISITEEILERVLRSHLFVADLTLANHGALLELGVALGLKSNKQIVVLLQGNISDLHFDLKVTNVIRYDGVDAVDKIAAAFISAAKAFEEDVRRYVKSVQQSLSVEAIRCLWWYGRRWQDAASERPALHSGDMGPDFEDLHGPVRFMQATRELLSKRLMWTDYVPNAMPGKDYSGKHATRLGQAVIALLWPNLKLPSDAPTPN